MGNALTSNFDVAAQIAESVINRIFEAAYLYGNIPHKITRDFSESGFNGNADIDLFMPSLSFDVTSSDPNPIKIIFPLKAKLDIPALPDSPFNLEGDLSVITSVQKLTQYDSVIGQDVDVVVVNFTDLSDEDYTIVITDDVENKEIFETIIKEMVRSTLSNETENIALSPGVTHGADSVQYFDMKVKNDTSAADIDYMALLMNFSTTHTTPSTITRFLDADKDFALAICSDMVHQSIDEKIVEKFGHALPARLPDDSSIVLRSLNLTLKNGYIRVSGSLTKEIDCWWDADVDFSGDVTLSVSPGGALVAKSSNTDVDLPWWADFLGIIIPVIGWITLAIVYDIVEDMAGDLLSSEVTSAFSGLSVFPATIPQVGGMVEEAPSFSTVNKSVEIRETGLIIQGLVYIGDEEIPIENYPLVGNKHTKELHYANCYWVTQMYDNNKKGFGRAEDAFALGYNGCWYCMRDKDTG